MVLFLLVFYCLCLFCFVFIFCIVFLSMVFDAVLCVFLSLINSVDLVVAV